MPAHTPPALIFLHLPKTGGTTLESYLKDVFPLESRWCESDGEPPPAGYLYGHRFSTIRGFEDLSRYVPYDRIAASMHNLVPTVPLYSGHIYFGFHRALKDRPFRYLTLIRDPVERIVSYLNTLHSIRPDLMKHYEDWIRECSRNDKVHEFDNYQTRALVASGLSLKHCSRSTYLEATKNLRDHFIAGTTDRLTDVLSLLAQEFSLPLPTEDRRLNVTHEGQPVKGYPSKTLSKMPLEAKHIADMKRRNKWDMKLYEFAGQLLDERLKTSNLQRVS